MRLAPAAPRLDVAEQALEVADLGGDALHLSHRLLHLRELVRDAGEALRHLLLHRLVELLIHRPADLGEAERALLAQLAQLGFEQRLRVALLAHHRKLQAAERLPRLQPRLLRQQAQALHLVPTHAPEPEQHDGREHGARDCGEQDGQEESVGSHSCNLGEAWPVMARVTCLG